VLAAKIKRRHFSAKCPGQAHGADGTKTAPVQVFPCLLPI